MNRSSTFNRTAPNQITQPARLHASDVQANPSKFEKAFAFFVLFLSTGSLVRILSPSQGRLGSSTTFSDPRLQTIWAAAFVITAILIVSAHRQGVKFESGGVFLWALILWAPISALWSDAPRLSLQRGLALVGSSLFAIYLANRFPTNDIGRHVSLVILIVIALSFIYVIVFPSVSINPINGAWQGIFTHKNELGRIMALGATVYLVRHRNHPRDLLASIFLISISIILILLSDSVTSLFVAASLMSSLVVLRISRKLPAIGSVFLMIFGMIGPPVFLWLLESREGLLSAVGRDPTLTGRTQLWSSVWKMIQERMWLGYGYDAFWRGGSGPAAQVRMATGYDAPHSHNGFLDLWLNLGVFGVTLGLIVLFTTAIQLLLLRRSNENSVILLIAFFLFVILFNMTESSFLVRNSIFWILTVVVVVKARVLSQPLHRGRKSALDADGNRHLKSVSGIWRTAAVRSGNMRSTKQHHV